MPHTSLRLSAELLGELDDEADAHDVPRSEHIRNTLKERHELDELRQENERLERRVRALIEQREEHTELVRYAEQQRSVLERQEERNQRREERRQANALRRAWWWLAGAPEDSTDS